MPGVCAQDSEEILVMLLRCVESAHTRVMCPCESPRGTNTALFMKSVIIGLSELDVLSLPTWNSAAALVYTSRDCINDLKY